MNNEFDLVICVGPHDNSIVEHMLNFNKKNIIGYRNIYLVCENPSINIPGTITIDEKIFPFNKNDLVRKFGNNDRNGWYLQQLLKFYAGNVIPDILHKYLIVDCDTHFLKPTKFITDDGKYIYTTGTEYNVPYFEHMNRLDPSLKKIHSLSGISHHMFFDTKIINEIMDKVEKNFQNKKKFWEIFLDTIDIKQFMGSAASEYEIYFTYMYLYHNEKIFIRQLNWENVSRFNPSYVNKYDYVSMHWNIRK